MKLDVFADGFEAMDEYFKIMPDEATQAARMAINDTVSGLAIRRARAEVMDQVNFPNGYLTADRLGVAKLARNHDLEAIISGRDRPTSLARFAVGGARAGQRGVRVAVHKGGGTLMRRAFIVPLKGANGEGKNLGLAIRLKPGEVITGRREAGNVNYSTFKSDSYGTIALLYGPSVDQVFGSVADDITPEVIESVTSEFFRQFARLTDA